jgi:hypothetical protein
MNNTLVEISTIIFKNEAEFIKCFAPDDTSDLVSISLKDDSVIYQCILYSGQHIVSTITKNDLLEFLFKLGE